MYYISFLKFTENVDFIVLLDVFSREVAISDSQKSNLFNKYVDLVYKIGPNGLFTNRTDSTQ